MWKKLLPFLAEKHDLTIFTKGEPNEQTRKIEQSRTGGTLFAYTAIPRRRRIAKLTPNLARRIRNFDLERTWMIGNSPKSDINPALAKRVCTRSGCPTNEPGALEREEIREVPGKLVVIQRFGRSDRLVRLG